jgi:RNA polymerase sigma factor (sigma-70 family)
MKNASILGAVKGIRRLVESQQADELSDRELLERFVAWKDEVAFAQLVRRHGPMVLGVCYRILRNRHDAEDAFQAAFLVLARKASAIRGRNSAGSWLFQVTSHLALKMKAKVDRQRTCVLDDIAGVEKEYPQPDRDLLMILDEELCRLPDKYRVVLLLCYYEDQTRAEAACRLGCKEGTVKIRLERGRTLLRARLARRGVALSGSVVGLLLARNAAPAIPPTLVNETAVAAAKFALGNLPATFMSNSVVVLAREVLNTMFVTRVKFAVLLVLFVGVALFGAGVGSYRALGRPQEEDGPAPVIPEKQRQPDVQPKKLTQPPPAKEAKKLLRVLLVADAPTREYQFVRSLFIYQMDKKEMELCIHLQKTPAKAVQDVPPDRLLRQFPTRLTGNGKKEDADDNYGNLSQYDVIIAFDPDWTKLSAEQMRLLNQWVTKQGGALVFVAGPVHTLNLARPGPARELKPIKDLLPVELEDSRIAEERETNKPWPLRFTSTEKFLQLNDRGNDSLGGWSEFFFDSKRNDWLLTEDRPLRGFYTAYPVKSVKPTAKVIATFRDPKARIAGDTAMPQELPYLVAMSHGKSNTIYIGSGETWRLREFNIVFHERLWTALVHYAASVDPARLQKSDNRSPHIPREVGR